MNQPLAAKMRPTKLAEVIGQEHLTTKGQVLNQMIATKTLPSMILYGPPGTGKTSLAVTLAKELNYPLRLFNAATNTKAELQIIAQETKLYDHLVVILDEIHRLDKSKQDFLLPLIEAGDIILIGATTENPFLTINPAIRSRVHLFELHALTKENIIQILKNTLTNKQKGLGNFNIQYDEEVLTWIANQSNGDVRYALNNLELAVKLQQKNDIITLTTSLLEPLFNQPNVKIDKNADNHYDLLSALQKSIRGSDVDAALHYLARLILGGDLESITRRLLVIAYEDIGLGNPQLPSRVNSAVDACLKLGLPEARIPLAHIVIDLCLSPKSNSAILAIDKALDDLKTNYWPDIPKKLKDSHFNGATELDHGTDYLYPHNYPNGYVKQNYLPEGWLDKKYYTPKNTGKYERALAQYYQQLKQQ